VEMETKKQASGGRTRISYEEANIHAVALAMARCFRQALARRGFPDKLYTDQGKIFTSYHLQIVCANLGVRLCHAKPYAAWSRGKHERWFQTLQEDFESRLVIDPVHTLEHFDRTPWFCSIGLPLSLP
jgi:transposase InsO family protein